MLLHVHMSSSLGGAEWAGRGGGAPDCNIIMCKTFFLSCIILKISLSKQLSWSIIVLKYFCCYSLRRLKKCKFSIFQGYSLSWASYSNWSITNLFFFNWTYFFMNTCYRINCSPSSTYCGSSARQICCHSWRILER